MTSRILSMDSYDIRFPASRERHGSDAMNPGPDYSAAYVVIRSGRPGAKMSDGAFSGLTALVTGGASGIGLAAATMLADRGAKVACLDLNPGGLEPPLSGVAGDVAEDSVADAVNEAAAALGGLDTLVNNRRLVTAQEVAAAICYLASPASGAVTGVALAVDGGIAGVWLPPGPGQ